MMPASPSAWTGDRPPPGRRVGGIIALALMLGACGEAEPLDPAALGELCGAAGPFRLLPLTPDERPVPEASIVRVGERIVLAIGAGEPRRDSLRGPVPASTTVYALGPCGEDPVVIGRDIDRVFMVPQWPGVVLGCEAETDDLLRLDPTGAAAPERLASACEATWTPAGLIHVERTELQRVVFQPYVAPGQLRFGAAIVLFEDSRQGDSSFVSPHPLADGALVLRADGDLVHVGLDGGVRVDQPGVRYYALSPDDRFMIWQALASEDPDAEFPEGDIFVRDRSNGGTALVAHAYLPTRRGDAAFPELDAAQVTLGDTLAGQWLVELPSFALRSVPEGRQLFGRIADGRWLTRSALFGPWLLRDLETGAETPVADRKGWVFGDHTGHLDLLDTSGYINYRSVRRLLRFPYDGGEPRVLAPRATRGSYFLPDGRVVSPVDINGDWIGTLALTDPATLEELQIDDHVVAALDLERWRDAFAPDVVAYVVADGERSGVWLARPE